MILLFTLAILFFSLLLRAFYVIQRKAFERSYYSFYELVTGIPPSLSIASLFFLRFLPPFLVGFIAFRILDGYFNYNFAYYSAIGAVAALVNLIPSLYNIDTYNGDDSAMVELKSKITSLYIIYFFYFLSFLFFSGLGAYLAATLSNSHLLAFLPSRQGIVDGLWAAIIIVLLSKLNRPL